MVAGTFGRALRLLSAVLMPLMMVGCAAAPEYTDPMAELGRSVAMQDQPFAKVRLGVLPSTNTKKAMGLLEGNRDLLKFGGLESDRQDRDPARISRGMNQILSNRFQDVRRIDKIEDARANDLDLIMVLDVKVIDKMVSFTTSSVEIEGIFLDHDGTEITRLKSRAENMVPYPAFSVVGKTINQVLTTFQQKLDEPGRLAQAAGQITGAAPQVTVAPGVSVSEPVALKLSAVPSGSDFGRYEALVIGNNAYQHLPHLKTAVNDADAVANLLRRDYGYAVSVLKDASREQILDAFDRLRGRLSSGDNLLIYYAGHGWYDEDAKRGYWLPVDARKDTTSRWVSNATVSDKLTAFKAKHVMVVADSCYSGTLTRGIKMTTRSPGYLRRIVSKRSRTVLTSGGLEPVTDSGGGANSVFAKAFLEALANNTGIIDGTQLFGIVREPVRLNAPQEPQYSNIRFTGHEIGGDYLFVRRR